jgi:hypothetical protein
MKGAVLRDHHFNNHTMSSAPDFTKACIVMFGVNLSWVFILLWAAWGLLAVAGVAWGINRWLCWLDSRRTRRLAPTPVTHQ